MSGYIDGDSLTQVIRLKPRSVCDFKTPNGRSLVSVDLSASHFLVGKYARFVTKKCEPAGFIPVVSDVQYKAML